MAGNEKAWRVITTPEMQCYQPWLESWFNFYTKRNHVAEKHLAVKKSRKYRETEGQAMR